MSTVQYSWRTAKTVQRMDPKWIRAYKPFSYSTIMGYKVSWQNMDEFRALISTQREHWDRTVGFVSLTHDFLPVRVDSDSRLNGKKKGGGVVQFVINWTIQDMLLWRNAAVAVAVFSRDYYSNQHLQYSVYYQIQYPTVTSFYSVKLYCLQQYILFLL